jgi:hypothetical protein
MLSQCAPALPASTSTQQFNLNSPNLHIKQSSAASLSGHLAPVSNSTNPLRNTLEIEQLAMIILPSSPQRKASESNSANSIDSAATGSSSSSSPELPQKYLRPGIIRLPSAAPALFKSRSKSVHFSTSVSVINLESEDNSVASSTAAGENSEEISDLDNPNSSSSNDNNNSIDGQSHEAKLKLIAKHRRNRRDYLMHTSPEIPADSTENSSNISSNSSKFDFLSELIEKNPNNAEENLILHSITQMKAKQHSYSAELLPKKAEKQSKPQEIVANHYKAVSTLEEDVSSLNLMQLFSCSEAKNNEETVSCGRRRAKGKFSSFSVLIPALFEPQKAIRQQLSGENSVDFCVNRATEEELSQNLYSALLNNYLAVEICDKLADFAPQITQLRLFLFYAALGCNLLKFRRRGRPHAKKLRLILSGDRVEIQWNSKKLLIQRKYLGFFQGKQGDYGKSKGQKGEKDAEEENGVFSLVFAGRKEGEQEGVQRVLCFQAGSEEQKKIWGQGIELLKRFLI